MPDSAWIAIIVTLALFVVTNIVVTVWWAARMETTLKFVTDQITILVDEVKLAKMVFVTKEQFTERVANVNKEIEAIWRNIDAIKSKT